MWLATVLLSGFVTLAFGTVTVLALRNCSKAGRMRKQIGNVLRQIGEGDQIAAEVTAVQNPEEQLGALCAYELSFSGKEGLSRRILLPMRLDLGNRLTAGDQVLLRAAGAPVQPLLETVKPVQKKGQPALPMQQFPADTTGTVLLESDFFTVREQLAKRSRQCAAQVAGNAVCAFVSLFLTLISLIITLGSMMI